MTEQPAPITHASTTHVPTTPPERRGFFAGVVAIVAGTIITLTPLGLGGMFSLDPIRRKRSKFLGADPMGYFAVTKLSELPADGTPVRFTIRADLVDAWNLFKDRTIGSVYLRQIVGAANPVIAFTDVCPHLGCKVNYQTSSKTFYCPCHASSFDLEGDKLNKIPPRGMDGLDAKVDAEGRVWVKYLDFRGAIAEKILS